MLKIDLSKQAENFLRKLPAKHAKQIPERIRALASDPDSVQSAEPKGHSPLMRMRSGEYRVIYAITGDTLEILIVGKRNDDKVYKLVERFRR